MVCALCLIAAGRKRGCRDLQRCVVGNIEVPIVVKARSLRRSKSRSATASSSAISFRFVLCTLSHPNFCQSSKLILVLNQEEFTSSEYVRQEVVTLGNSATEFIPLRQRGVHLAHYNSWCSAD